MDSSLFMSLSVIKIAITMCFLIALYGFVGQWRDVYDFQATVSSQNILFWSALFATSMERSQSIELDLKVYSPSEKLVSIIELSCYLLDQFRSFNFSIYCNYGWEVCKLSSLSIDDSFVSLWASLRFSFRL